MNRRIMVVVVAGVMLAAGIVALAGAAAGGGNADRSAVMAASPTKISPWAASEGGGIGLTDDIGLTDGNGLIAGRKPGVGTGDTAGSGIDPAVTDEPSTEIRSEAGGEVALNTDPVQAGGVGGGVIGSRSDDTVLAGGAAGGVLGSRSGDTVLAGSESGVDAGSGRSVLSTEPATAGGKGGIFGDC